MTCTFENTGQGVTRTQGFWATHTKLAGPAWSGGTSNTYPTHTFPGVAGVLGDTKICGREIDTLGKLMGGFWSDVSKKSTGAKRTSLDQARVQLLQQLLAAELNASAFGSVPAGGIGQFTSCSPPNAPPAPMQSVHAATPEPRTAPKTSSSRSSATSCAIRSHRSYRHSI